MNVRIVVLNAPRSIGAVLPGLTLTPQAATNGVCRVTGAPGTLAVPAPRPSAVPQWGPTPKTQDSANAPTAIRPSLYVATPECGRPPMYIGPDRISPVPAVASVRVAQDRFQSPKRIGGRRVTRAARPFIVWPTYGKG